MRRRPRLGSVKQESGRSEKHGARRNQFSNGILCHAPAHYMFMNNGLRRTATSLLLIVVIALVTRSAFAWYQVRQFHSQVLGVIPFQTETGHIAYSIASGKGFSSPFQRDTGPTAWLAPVYPYLLAGIFKVFGIYTLRSFFIALLLNILYSAGVCVPIFYAGKRIAGLGVASAAAWLWALFPNAIVIPFQWIWDTSLSALLAAIILWATYAVIESEKLRDWCAYGFLWGFALLTNPALGAALPFLLGWIAYRGRHNTRGRFFRPAAALGVAILCCVPWTVRNYMEFHRFIPLRSNLPFELWLGNNKVFDDRSPDVNARVTRYEEERRYVQLGETAFMKEKWNLGTEFIRTHKRLEARLVGWRFMDFWLGSFHPVQDFENSNSAWIRIILAFNLITAIGSLIGIVVLWRRGSLYVFPAAVFVLAVPLVYYATHASLRYRHPIDPIVLMLTAIAVTGAKPREDTIAP